MRHRSVLAAASALAFVALARPAAALGNEDDVVFSADRLMGFYMVEGNATFGLGIPAQGPVYTTPRFAMDFFVSGHLNLGIALGYANAEGGDDGFLLLAPRVGYAIPIGRSFGFWPRGGLTFSTDRDELAITLEGVFWAEVAPHFALTFGPAFDIGMAAEGEEIQSFGIITMGLGGWF